MEYCNLREPLVFLSHSSHDKTFARKLDATLTSSGIKTFIDERDIKVGESIPARVYESLGAASHIIYVISKAAIASPWVQEELSIAKMREKSAAGVRVLPIVIEEVELPTAVVHVKHLTLVQWADPQIYANEVRRLLEALGCTLIQPVSTDHRFSLANFALLHELENRMAKFTGYVEAAYLAVFLRHDTGNDYDVTVLWLLDKYFEDDGSLGPSDLETFADLCKQNNLVDRTTSTGCAYLLALDLLAYFRRTRGEFKSHPFLHACRHFSAAIASLRSEFMASTASRMS